MVSSCSSRACSQRLFLTQALAVSALLLLLASGVARAEDAESPAYAPEIAQSTGGGLALAPSPEKAQPSGGGLALAPSPDGIIFLGSPISISGLGPSSDAPFPGPFAAPVGVPGPAPAPLVLEEIAPVPSADALAPVFGSAAGVAVGKAAVMLLGSATAMAAAVTLLGVF
eukprot:jgi/Mesen1/6666/ME000340S05825